MLCNQASVDRELRHIIDLMLPEHQDGRLKIGAVFGPQHGLFGHTQDNMIEWEGAVDPRTGLTVHSLYGESREPNPKSLEGIDLFLVDIPDVGSRYYTFVWSMANCMKVCESMGIPVHVLDRPNPIGGTRVEGTLLKSEFASFVGEYPLPTRHGMTVGEIATYLKSSFFPKLTLTVTAVEDWARSEFLDETDVPWVMPSPNMPTLDTAIVYPGGCLLEATNLSEGRGTTRPFEIVGAPFLDAWKLANALNGLELPGVTFRPIQFEPTFNKHARTLCGGVFVHVTERRAFEPVLSYIAIMQEAIRFSGLVDSTGSPKEATFKAESAETKLQGFAWRQPPYEYESEKMPIDILAGNDWLLTAIEKMQPLNEIRERMLRECAPFESVRHASLLYPTTA